jgi:hypothetical protein
MGGKTIERYRLSNPSYIGQHLLQNMRTRVKKNFKVYFWTEDSKRH